MMDGCVQVVKRFEGVPSLSLLSSTETSLARHTLQSQEKEGLVTSRTTSCSGDRIWSRPIRFEILNLLLSNALLAARAYSRPAWFAVTRDVFCNYCIPPEQLVVREVTRPSFSCSARFPRGLKGVASETIQRHRKFSTVFGHTSLKSSNTILPAGD